MRQFLQNIFVQSKRTLSGVALLGLVVFAASGCAVVGPAPPPGVHYGQPCCYTYYDYPPRYYNYWGGPPHVLGYYGHGGGIHHGGRR